MAEYFDRNPVSQLGVVVTRDKVAQRLTPISSNPTKHADKLEEVLQQSAASGQPSLQNALLVSKAMLDQAPGQEYASKEILIMCAAPRSPPSRAPRGRAFCPGDTFKPGGSSRARMCF